MLPSSKMFTKIVFVLTCCLALASVHSAPPQDFCVADPNSNVVLNGLACKDSKLVVAEEFHLAGLNLTGNTSNPFRFKATPVTVAQLPGLNTLGISMVRLDFAPWGLNPPHTHPRASEMLTVLEGTLEVGFITSNPENQLFKKVLNKGDVFVFPMGLIHFQRNVGYGNAVAVGALNSESPGVITIANSVFGSNPSIPSDVLAKAFQVDQDIISQLLAKF